MALGSNQGERAALLCGAVSTLALTPELRLVATSRVYETTPVGGPPQPDYLNAVVELRTALEPRALLARLHELEIAAGRVRPAPAKNLPRPLDLDLLLVGELCIDEPGLTLPHPRLHERGFVLAPLVEIAPSLVHPGLGRTIEALLGELPASTAPRCVSPPHWLEPAPA